LLGEPPKDEEGTRKKKNKQTKEEKVEKKQKQIEKATNPDQPDDSAPTRSIADLIGRDMNSAVNTPELL